MIVVWFREDVRCVTRVAATEGIRKDAGMCVIAVLMDGAAGAMWRGRVMVVGWFAGCWRDRGDEGG